MKDVAILNENNIPVAVITANIAKGQKALCSFLIRDEGTSITQPRYYTMTVNKQLVAAAHAQYGLGFSDFIRDAGVFIIMDERKGARYYDETTAENPKEV